MSMPSLRPSIPSTEEQKKFRASTLPFDVAWCPDVAPGHTSYSWKGHHDGDIPQASYILGCVRAEEKNAE